MTDEMSEIKNMFLGLMERREQSRNTFATPTVRMSGETLRGLLGETIARVDARIVAARARLDEQQRTLTAARDRGLPLTMRDGYGPPGPEYELGLLVARRELLGFASKYLVVEATYEMEAVHAHAFLSDNPSGSLSSATGLVGGLGYVPSPGVS